MADPLERCPQCGEALPSPSDRDGQCFQCGATLPSQPPRTVSKSAKAGAAKPPVDRQSRSHGEDDQAPSRPARSTRASEARGDDRPHNPWLTPLRLVSGAYFPFLGGMVLASAVLAALVAIKWHGFFAIVLAGLLIVTSIHIVIGLLVLFQKVDEGDEFEIELPDQWQRGLAALVKHVASQRGLDSPDVIRLHAQSLAHVYMDHHGRSILVVGGPLIGILSQRALAGVIAHELSHFTAGDARRSRLAWRRHRVMENLEARFLTQNWAVWNPWVWLIRLYHHIYFRLHYASQRREEFLADSYEADHVGKEEAAMTTVLLHVIQHMPWANLANMAERMSMGNYHIDHLFEEQMRRLRAASKSDWEEALRKALREKTEWDSTHPCLKARLKPFGVKARDVLPLAMNMTGKPATELFANWPEVEKHLSKMYLSIARAYFRGRQQACGDIAAIVKAS